MYEENDFMIIGARHRDGVAMALATQLDDIEIQSGVYCPCKSCAMLPPRYEWFPGQRESSTDNAFIKARSQRVMTVNARDYPQAWQQMFDLWTPPSFTEQTRAQILTQFIFNPPGR